MTFQTQRIYLTSLRCHTLHPLAFLLPYPARNASSFRSQLPWHPPKPHSIQTPLCSQDAMNNRPVTRDATHCPGLSALLLMCTFPAKDLPPGRYSGHQTPLQEWKLCAPSCRNAARWPPSAVYPLALLGLKVTLCSNERCDSNDWSIQRLKKWLNAFLPTKDDSEETSELQTPTQQGTSWDLSWDCITDSFLLLPSPISIHFFHTCWC